MQGIATNSRGSVASVSWDGTCQIFDHNTTGEKGSEESLYVQSWYHEARTQNKGVYAVASTGTLLGTACRDTCCYLLCSDTKREKARLVGHSGEVNDVAFGEGGDVLASVSDDKTCIRAYRYAGFVCLSVCLSVCLFVCLCMYACMYVCMYVCLYVGTKLYP